MPIIISLTKEKLTHLRSRRHLHKPFVGANAPVERCRWILSYPIVVHYLSGSYFFYRSTPKTYMQPTIVATYLLGCLFITDDFIDRKSVV